MSLSQNQPISKKQYSLLFALLLSPIFFFAQTTLSGLWVGSINNDSTTVRKDQSFELVLSEYKGKVTGYSRSEFIVNDTLYYIVKKVKGEIEGDTCKVTDDDIVAHNFNRKPDKGVKVTSTFVRNSTDSTWRLDGKWKTNKTKNYYSVTGKVSVAEEKDVTASKIFPHLEELNLANDIAFYKERTEQPLVIRKVKPESYQSLYGVKNIESTTTIAVAKPDLQRAESFYAESVKRPETNIISPEKKIENTSVSVTVAKPDLRVAESYYTESVAATTGNSKTSVNKVNERNIAAPQPSKPDLPIAKPAYTETTKTTNNSQSNKPLDVNSKIVTKPVATEHTKTIAAAPQANDNSWAEDIATVTKTPTSTTTNKPALTTNQQPVVNKPIVISTPGKTNDEITANALTIGGRKSAFTQEVNFTSDSLVIALYDNGEIDGDTVSVFLNGETIMSHQGLKASAVKKTIYITPGKEDFSLVLFADNLGKYPPNTGLLVVYDGEDTFNLRFSSDFNKNAGIIFRRKR